QAEELVKRLGLQGRVRFLGPYTQVDAPSIFRQAHILLHTKVNDPCPGLVVEAMACGLPVVYSRSGGLPELVGDQAGVGVSAELDWNRDVPPDSESMANAVVHVVRNRDRYAQAARRRAMERFDLQPWLARHREVFATVLR
ncbi:MAG: glycosyltransferase, partial [Nitrospirota bacterium]|nr:glycosyltransferase [Nitrospirota bacterium]